MVSLLDVLNFYAHSFLKQLKLVEEIERELEENRPMALGRSVSQLKQLGLIAGQLGFQHLERDGERIFQLSNEGKITPEIALHESREFRRRLLEELARPLFFAVSAADREFYERPRLTPGTANSFPAADEELTEAGKCLSLDRHTAAVYHAMRALESGLIALAQRLKVKAPHRNWGALIDLIEAAIRSVPATRLTPARRKLLSFYSETALHFRFLKDAWRNHAAHLSQNYNRERAEKILDHVSGLFEEMSKGGLHEQRTR